jgi:hypothetical protein
MTPFSIVELVIEWGVASVVVIVVVSGLVATVKILTGKD